MNEQPTVPVGKENRKDTVFAILSLLMGFLFVKYALTSAPGLLLFLLICVFLTVGYAYALLQKTKIPPASYLWAAVILTFACSFWATANGFLKGWCCFFEILACAYWVLVTFSNRQEHLNDMLGFDLLKCLFVLPFGNGGALFTTFAENAKQNRGAKRILYVFLGLLLAIVPSAIVFVLLASADQSFSKLTEVLFADVGMIIFNNAAPAFLTLPLGLLIFGLLHGAARKKFSNCLTRSQKEATVSAIQRLSSIITCAMMTPMLLIYGLFFISQSDFFLSAFANIKPEGSSYAEFAQEGFFNLCAVCAINGLVILFIHFFTKRNGNKQYPLAAKIYVSLFALSSILLAVTALRKMILYIQNYGLTLSRVYASWFILLLSVFFLILIVKQFLPRINGTLPALLAFLLLFGGMCLCNVDARIAEYNLQHYITGELKTVDFDMLREKLSPVAIVAVDEAYDQLDDEAKEKADAFFLECAYDFSEEDFFQGSEKLSFRSWNKDTARAEQILRRRVPDVMKDADPVFGWTW